MQLMKTKKGYNLQDLATVGVTFVIVAIILGIGVKIVVEMNQESTGTVVNATYKNATEALAELSSWLPTIALIIAAAVIIGIVVTYFAFRRT